jgi:hypothetical protein
LDATAFGHGPGERLLAIDVSSATNCCCGRDGVGVVRGGHHHRFDVLLVEQISKIGVGPGRWMFLRGSRKQALVDVAQGHDVLTRDIA